jgi:hypothetical protein
MSATSCTKPIENRQWSIINRQFPLFSTIDRFPVAAREARIAARKILSYDIRSIIAGLFVAVAFRRIFSPTPDPPDRHSSTPSLSWRTFTPPSPEHFAPSTPSPAKSVKELWDSSS